MSADNWTICPRCVDNARKEYKAEHAKVMALYGKVPVEEFDAARAALKEVEPTDHYTFREDYEFYGAESGELHAFYKGRCAVCELHHEREFDEVWYQRA